MQGRIRVSSVKGEGSVFRVMMPWQAAPTHTGGNASTPSSQLGDLHGIDVTDGLSLHAHTMALPKVALSADVMPDQLQAARDRGFLDYLTKPLDVARLLKLLDSFEQQPGANAAASAQLAAKKPDR